MSVTGNKLTHIAVMSAYLDLGDVQDPIKNDPSHNLIASCENNDKKGRYFDTKSSLPRAKYRFNKNIVQT